MFRVFYGMTENPFDKETRVKEFETSDYRAIKDRIDYIANTRGLATIVGEPGTGKSYSVKKYVDSNTDKKLNFIYVHSTSVTTLEFYRALCYGLKIDPSHRKVDMMHRINERITKIFKESNKETPIIIIDEAQYLLSNSIYEISLLLNYEYDTRNYLTIILVGNKNLLDILARPSFEAIRQRICVRYETQGLTPKEFNSYVNSRLALVDCKVRMFDESIINAIYNLSDGNLRIANQILTVCLIEGANKKETLISHETLNTVMIELKLKK
jgi:type II secretory pathway predicted ATPase ExeA